MKNKIIIGLAMLMAAINLGSADVSVNAGDMPISIQSIKKIA